MQVPRVRQLHREHGVIRWQGARVTLHFGRLSGYCDFGCDRYHSLCFLRPNSQCAQKLFMGLGPVVIDTRLAFQTVLDAMTISPVSLQNLHLTSAMAFTLPLS